MIDFNTHSAIKKPRYRTIKECHEELLKRDEKCKITVYCIRTLCKENQIKHITIGSKTIVNLDDLFSFLGISDTPTQSEQQSLTRIITPSKCRPCFEYG